MTAHNTQIQKKANHSVWARAGFLRVVFFWIVTVVCTVVHATPQPSVALHYGANPPLGDLQAFDIVVLEPDHHDMPRKADYPNTQFYAYASVTEVQRTRPYYGNIPASWKLGRNGQWDSDIIDQSITDWPSFFTHQVIGPLWAKGYRGFFLDTLDSYRLASQFDEAAQQAGMVRVINSLHQQFPGIQLIFNRGFDILPQLKGKVQMVAAESLYQRWNASTKTYEPVPDADRDWLLQQLRAVQQRDSIPAIAIDYAPPQNRQQTREIAQRIQADGLIPWVTDGDVSTVGIGSVEAVPRHVLVVYNGDESPSINYSKAHRFLQTPLNHMGYVVDYADTRDPLPEGIWQDRYAGVVTWFTGYVDANASAQLNKWLTDKLSDGMPLAVMGDFGFTLTNSWAQTLGLKTNLPTPQGALVPESTNAMLGFEQALTPINPDLPLVQLRPAAPGEVRKPDVLITLKDPHQNAYTGGAIMPWGGFLLQPFTVVEIPGTEQFRWVTNPFAFLQQALRLPNIPIPDITTENGLRLLLAHVDGDGFASKAELQGSPFAADVLLTRILQKYPIPHAVSVIEGETAPHGLYPTVSHQIEAIARQIFALPHVEIANHTYGHPFLWDRSVKHGVFAEKDGAAYNLPLRGYRFDLRREIVGSTEYINKNLAPPNKRTRILLWSGDTAPNAEALKITDEAGLLNMNGGDTYISKSYPSLTAVGSLGIVKGGYLQVYAPITNENIYTNLWTGPFYGFQQVLETFAMTEKPRRLKPVGIYYHTYSTSKRAGLIALEKAYQWAMAQPLNPIYPSEYIRKVQDFYNYSIAQKGNSWQLRGRGHLRTVRWPLKTGEQPDMSSGSGVAGWSAGSESPYVHLTGAQSTLTPIHAESKLQRNQQAPYLYEANARIGRWEDQQTPHRLAFRLEGHVTPLQFALAHSQGCSVQANNRLIKPSSMPPNPLQAQQNLQRFTVNHASAQIQIQCSAR